MNKYGLLTLPLVVQLALTGCAVDVNGVKPAMPARGAEAGATTAVCKEVQRVHITAVNPASSPANITLDAGKACLKPGSGLVIWTFQNVNGYVFAADAVKLKPDQSDGLLASFVSPNKTRFFAVFDSDSAATWQYNINFKSVDGKQIWNCDPTIVNQASFMLASDNTAICVVTAGP